MYKVVNENKLALLLNSELRLMNGQHFCTFHGSFGLKRQIKQMYKLGNLPTLSIDPKLSLIPTPYLFELFFLLVYLAILFYFKHSTFVCN